MFMYMLQIGILHEMVWIKTTVICFINNMFIMHL